MPGVLTITNQIMCPHGGLAILTTSNSQLLVDDSAALLETDVHEIAGCKFVIGLVYSPCVLIQWVSGATALKVSDVPVLHENSVGLCLNAAAAPQGVAMVIDSMPEMDAI